MPAFHYLIEGSAESIDLKWKLFYDNKLLMVLWIMFVIIIYINEIVKSR